MVGGLLHGAGPPDWLLLMVPPGEYSVRDTWHTTGMRGTGSNTIVTDNVFVPAVACRPPDATCAKARRPAAR